MPASQSRQTFGTLFRRPYQAYLNWLYAELARSGFPEVRVAHSAVFRTIAPEGSRLTDLAELAGMTKQSMSYLVEDLVRLGFLSLAPDPKDGRAKRVSLSERGRDLLLTARRLGDTYERHVAGVLGEGKATQLRTLLEELNEGLERAPHPSAGRAI